MSRIKQVLAALALAAGISMAAAAEPTRFSVEVVGEGPDVILIPGLASGRAAWAGEAERLEADHRVHLIELAGFAGSPAGAAEEGEVIAPAVEELAAYIREQGLVAPAVIGHSLGGLMGLMLARDHADAVGRLVVVDALPFYSAIFDPNATAASVAPQAGAMRDALLAQTDEMFAAGQRGGSATMVRNPDLREPVIDWSLASDRSVLARALYEDMTTDLRADVPTISTPILVIYAYAPEMGPEARVDGLYESAYAGAPDIRLERIDDSFHFIMLDQPDALHDAIAGFLP